MRKDYYGRPIEPGQRTKAGDFWFGFSMGVLVLAIVGMLTLNVLREMALWGPL